MLNDWNNVEYFKEILTENNGKYVVFLVNMYNHSDQTQSYNYDDSDDKNNDHNF